MKRAFETAIIAISSALILAVIAVLVRDRLGAAEARRTGQDRVIPRYAAYATRGYNVGSAVAPHTVVVFSDFDCNACRAFSKLLDTLRTSSSVRIVERHFPLTQLHQFAMGGALAAECARSMGSYESVRAVLYGRPAILQAQEWGLLALTAKVSDTAQFSRCVRSARFSNEVSEDLAAGGQLGVRGTPAVLVDSVLLGATPTLTELQFRVGGRGR